MQAESGRKHGFGATKGVHLFKETLYSRPYAFKRCIDLSESNKVLRFLDDVNHFRPSDAPIEKVEEPTEGANTALSKDTYSPVQFAGKREVTRRSPILTRVKIRCERASY